MHNSLPQSLRWFAAVFILMAGCLLAAPEIAYAAPPPAPTLNAPTGVQTTTAPEFQWTGNTASTRYYLSVSDASGEILGQWYESAAICSSSNCRVRPQIWLYDSTYTWKVQAQNAANETTWSSTLSFSVPVTTLTVNSTNDANDGTCDASHCSLREAITRANAVSGVDWIKFNITEAGPHTIKPANSLPPVNSSVIIDGTSEPDYQGSPVVELDGSLIAETYGGYGLHFSDTSDGSITRGLAIHSFNWGGIYSDGADYHLITGNFIGTDITGTSAPSEGGIGIRLYRATGVLIGGTAAGEGNLISGNEYGISISSSTVTLYGNRIGTDVSGQNPLGNELGIRVSIDYTWRDVTIGGTEPGQSNLIAYNTASGIRLESTYYSLINYQVRGNSIHSNGTMGIDLGRYGEQDQNDIGETDYYQNYPPITGATRVDDVLTVVGTLNSHKNTSFYIDLYTSASCDASGYGEGETYLGFTQVTTDANGNANFTYTLDSAQAVSASVITATATALRPNGRSTSEFSNCVTVATAPPGAASPTAPNGTATSATPSYSWPVVSTATQYLLSVQGEAGTVFEQTYSASPSCNAATCTVTPSTVLEHNKTYTWRIQTKNMLGDGPWSEPLTFTVDLRPVPPVLTSPTGTLVSYYRNVTLQWNKSTRATSYEVWVDGPTGHVIDQIVANDTNFCRSYQSYCTFTTPSLADGVYTWKVRGINEYGAGAWSETSFNLMGPPVAPVPISPNTTLTDRTPAYSWNASPNTTKYYVTIDGSLNSNVAYNATDICIDDVCTVEPNVPLLNGNHTWRVTGWNSAGYGASSASMTFGVIMPLPGTPVATAPSGTINTHVPTYSWTLPSDAMSFELEISGLDGLLINARYDLSICSAGTCSTAAPALPTGGAYSMRVRALNDSGAGSWSDPLAFTVNLSSVVTYTVNTTDDVDDGVCNSAHCSLREAINAANLMMSLNRISFNIPGEAPYTITPLTALPAITKPVILDATTQPGYAGAPLVELSGAYLSSADGLYLSAGNSVIRGLVINRFKLNGIRITTANGNTIQRNYIGTDASGTQDLGNGQNGIFVTIAGLNLIGGPGQGNVISGNGQNGIQIGEQPQIDSTIQSNIIGLDAAGSAALGNSGAGIFLQSANDTLIGGVDPATYNLIAHNGGEGILIQNGVRNAITGNLIFDNGKLGIELLPYGLTGNDLGDPDLGPNLRQNFPIITSATGDASSIYVSGTLNSRAHLSYLLQFYVSESCDPSGAGEGAALLTTTSLMTDIDGNASFSLTLPTAAPAGQFITATATDPNGNTSEFSRCAVLYSQAPGAVTLIAPESASTVTTPQITYRWTHTLLASRYYLSVKQGASEIVGQWVEAADVCSATICEVTPAVWFDNGSYTWSVQSANALYTGAWSAENPFDVLLPVPGAAELVYPTGMVTSASPTFTWIGDPHALRYQLWVDDSAGHVFDQVYNAADICVDNTCAIMPALALTDGAYSWKVLAQNGSGDAAWSSSLDFTVSLYTGSVLTVNSADDANDGTCDAAHCSLREAIIAANANAGSDAILFNIPGAGVHEIHVGNALPAVGDTAYLDATTQPGYAGTPLIDLHASGIYASGIELAGSNSVVRGFAINGFEYGMKLAGSGGHRVEANYVGVWADGSNGSNRTNGVWVTSSNNVMVDNRISKNQFGIFIEGNGITNNVIRGNQVTYNTRTGILVHRDSANTIIGGTDVDSGNLISQNGEFGIVVQSGSSDLVTSGTIIQGNLIGTDATGTLARGNGAAGIYLNTVSDTLIGGTVPGAGNVISGNNGSGIVLTGYDSTLDGIVIQGNIIGMDITASQPLPNAFEGIYGGRSTVTIGGLTPEAANIIAHNGRDGINLFDAPSSTFYLQGNRIFANGQQGIDIYPDGTNANDTGDGDTGPNLGQNYPVITSAAATVTQTSVDGTLNSTANSTFRLDFYASAACDPSGYGEGERYLGSTNVTTDANGDAAFAVTFDGAQPEGTAITATATDAAGSTSEFSACFMIVTQAPPAPQLLSPTGTIETPYPSFRWNPAPTATRYFVSVDTESGNVYGQWHEGAAVCSSYCKIYLPALLVDGSYTWKVRAQNAVGDSEWSQTLAFTIVSPDQGLYLFEPRGTIYTARPEYIWEEATDATGYDLRVEGASGEVLNLHYEAVDVCNYQYYCAALPDVPLAHGETYRWQIRTVNGQTIGAWSELVAFTVDLTPRAVTIIQPKGIVYQPVTALVWLPDAGSDRYVIEVKRSSGAVIYSGTVNESDSCASQCSLTLPEPLGDGSYVWTIYGQNDIGSSPVTSTPFIVQASPKTPVPLYPMDHIAVDTPLFAWLPVSNTETYRIQVEGAAGSLLDATYPAAEICNLVTMSACFATLPVPLSASGHYQWRVQSINQYGESQWSEWTGFDYALTPTQTLTVNTVTDTNDGTCDASHCSLREAITAANAEAGVQRIVFDIAGAAPHILTLTQELPRITDPLILDATIEPDYAGTPVVVIDGTLLTNSSSTGLRVYANGSVIRGLALIRFRGSALSLFSGGNRVEANFIGLDADSAPAGNSYGIWIDTFDLPPFNNVIGGRDAASGNVIANNTPSGIRILAGYGHRIEGNQLYNNGDSGIYSSLTYTPPKLTFAGSAAGELHIEGRLPDTNPKDGMDEILGDLATSDYRIEVFSNPACDPSGYGEGRTFLGAFMLMDAGARPIDFVQTLPVEVPTGHAITILVTNQYGQTSIFSNCAVVQTTLPGAVTLVSPNGAANSITPPLIWQPATYATRYEVELVGPTGTLLSQTYVGLNVCASVCTITSPTLEIGSTYTWRVRGINPLGAGEWSAQNTFEVYPLIVNTTSDANDGACSSAHCSLREAITAANATSNIDSISFNIPGGGPHLIQLTTGLPSVATPMILDATTQSSYSGTPLIEIRGRTNTSPYEGFYITSTGSTVRGFAINSINGRAVVISGDSNIVEANFIGTDVTGTLDLGNKYDGIAISGVYAHNNIIRNNVISGNDRSGITISGSVNSTVIEGNRIGTNAAGTAALPNSQSGISVSSGVANTRIGGTTLESRNLISGNGGSGVVLSAMNEPNVTGTILYGNYIGTDVTGTIALGNHTGISMNEASNSAIGGIAAGQGNLISGNRNAGITLIGGQYNSIRGNQIGVDSAGNPLGNGLHGVEIGPLCPAGYACLWFEYATDNIVEANLIAHNTGDGINMPRSTSKRNRITQNQIYANSGMGIDLLEDGPTANDEDNSDADPQNYPMIRSSSLDGGNLSVTATLNSAAGTYRIEFFANTACDPTYYGEGQAFIGFVNATISGTGSINISTTLPAPPEGMNYLTATAINAYGATSEFSPCVAVGSTIPGAVTQIAPTGVVTDTYMPAYRWNSEAQALRYHLIVNQGEAVLLDTWVEAADVCTESECAFTPDLWLPDGDYTWKISASNMLGDGAWSADLAFNIAGPMPAVPVGIAPTGSTAIISGPYEWQGQADHDLRYQIKIEGTDFSYESEWLDKADVCTGNLCTAMVNAPLVAGRDYTWKVRAANDRDTSEWSTPLSFTLVPILVNSTNDVNDGTCNAAHCSLREAILLANSMPNQQVIAFNLVGTAPYTIQPNTGLPFITETVTIDGTTQPGYAGQPVIQISGISSYGHAGLFLTGGGSTIRGLSIYGYAAAAGIWIKSSNNRIEGNYLGLRADGSGYANQFGVHVEEGTGNRIGGTTPETRNVISGNSYYGISLGYRSSSTVIQGNYIGTNPAGTAAVPNIYGIYGSANNNNLIGGSEEGAGNLISGNTSMGVFYYDSDQITIEGNRIGTDASGVNPLPNGIGIWLANGSINNDVRRNIIAFNNDAGIQVTDSTQQTIEENSVFANGDLGIEIGAAGVNPNDSGDADTGANGLLNFPVLTSVTSTPTEATIEGTYNSTPNAAYRLEFFNNTACDPSGYGEGESYLGAITVNTDAAGNASFSAVLPISESLSVVTATATDAQGNTSEFSACAQWTSPVATPSSLSAAALSKTSIQINWPVNPDPNLIYHIERWNDATNLWVEIGTANAGDGSYLDEGLACGTFYDYRVRAYDSALQLYSAYSQTLNLSTQQCSVFADVPTPTKEWMSPWIDQFYALGITTGCGRNQANQLIYCPEREVTRAEMAVFVLRAVHYPTSPYTPVPQSGTFADVPVADKEWMEAWIEEFFALGITTGCGRNQANELLFCPERPVTRAEMAVFVLRALEGSSYQPPAASHFFTDVPVVGKEWMAAWIDEFKRRGITTGCGFNAQNELLYCPERPVTRAEMAVFILRAFESLPNP